MSNSSCNAILLEYRHTKREIWRSYQRHSSWVRVVLSPWRLSRWLHIARPYHNVLFVFQSQSQGSGTASTSKKIVKLSWTKKWWNGRRYKMTSWSIHISNVSPMHKHKHLTSWANGQLLDLCIWPHFLRGGWSTNFHSFMQRHLKDSSTSKEKSFEWNSVHNMYLTGTPVFFYVRLIL